MIVITSQIELEDFVRIIYIVVAFRVNNKVKELCILKLSKLLTEFFIFFHGMPIDFEFSFSQFLLFACNFLLLW